MANETMEPSALRAKQAAAYCGMSRSTFLKLVSEGKAPKRRKISDAVVIWLRSDLDTWLQGVAK